MKKVLVLGAGMVARPLVRYLLDKGYELTQADLDVARAEAMIGGHERGRAVALDLADADALRDLVAAHDIAVSLVPPPFHPVVARACLDSGRPMATASYVSPEMAALDGEAREKGVTVINEIGVDPGIDIMSSMRVIDAVHARGGEVLSYRSYCGGLPAPECNDNPFGYKFSWAPRGVLMASRNDAEYMQHGMHVRTEGKRLFRDMHMLNVEGAGDFEAYPNRDSLSYIETYGLKNVRTMFRGTLRNVGWCDCLHHFGRLGLLGLDAVDVDGKTRADVVRGLTGSPACADPAEAAAGHLGVCVDSLPITNLRWLGMFDEAPAGEGAVAPLDVLGARMLEKLAFRPGERDMLVMKHEFVASYPDGHREQLDSRLVDFGIPDGDSSMARTVSLPLAIAARLILEQQITKPGVLRPVSADIYEPVLAELEQLGIVCEETTKAIEPAQGT